MNQTIAMDTPDISFIKVASEYWAYAVGLITGLGAIFLFYRQFCQGKYNAFIIWRRAFIALPVTLAKIESELHFGPGESLKQRLGQVGVDLLNLEEIISNEIANRRSALQFATMPLFEFDITGKLVWANDALLEMVDGELPDVEGSNWRNIVSGQHRVTVMAGWDSAVKDGTNFRTKFKLVTDKTEAWVVFNVACNKDRNGKVLGWLGKLRIIDPPI